METPEVYSLNTTGEGKASREQVYQALALIELFEALRDDFAAFSNSLPKATPPKAAEYKSLVKEVEAFEIRINSLVATLDTDVVPLPSIAETIRGGAGSNAHISKIERLGIGGELLRLRRQPNMTISKIAERYTDVSENLIRRYFRVFDAAKPSEKVKMRRSSMQDIFERIEDLASIITRGLARLEGIQDDIHVKYIAEMRQLIDTSAKVSNQMMTQLVNVKAYEGFVQTVSEILQRELPERQTEIIKKISVHLPGNRAGFSIGSAQEHREVEAYTVEP